MSQKQVKRKKKAKAAKNRLAGLLPPDIPVKDLSKNDNGDYELPLRTGGPRTYFKVPGELAQQLLDYIQLKPYAEVHGLIGGLMRCEKLKE